MTSEHIYRDFTNHTRSVFRPLHEYVGVEIFSYEHEYTSTFHPSNYTFTTTNAVKKNHRHLKCLATSETNNVYAVSMKYNCKEIGEHRIDILYENTNAKDYTGMYAINPTSKISTKNQEKVEKQIKDLEDKIDKIEKQITAQELYISDLKKTFKSKMTKKEYEVALKANNTHLSHLKKELKTAKLNLKAKEEQLAETHIVKGKEISLDGEKNILKRKTLFVDFKETGNQRILLELPPNVYFIGVIVRKIKLFTGDIVDAEYSRWKDTNLELTECEVTESSETSPNEAKFTIGYSQTFDCLLSRTGLYMDYMDEVNVYYRTNELLTGEVVRRFGGYISSIQLSDDRTNIDISCGDRRIDGEHKYILDSLIILYGTQSEKDMEYYKPINFNNYGKALKYLCDVFETTLNSNISKNYLVEGEKYSTGVSIKFGKKKDIKKVTASNAYATMHNNFVTLRNKPKGDKKQSILLYDGEKQSKKPINISKHMTFHITYGLGKTKTTDKSSTTEKVDNSENSAGSQKFSKCGVSADGKYVMAIGQRSSGKDPKVPYGTLYKSVFVNKCPHCGKATLRWDSCRKDTKCIYTGRWNGTKGTWHGGIPETEITCTNCDSDFSVFGIEKDPPWKKLTKVGGRKVSSKAEQTKLHRGKMVAVPKGGTKVSADSVLKSVAKIAKQYKYERGTKGQTYSQMKKTGHGDCWGFSDLIWTELKKYGVKCKIYEYNSGSSNQHRIVVYLNANNQWSIFPYAKYNVYPNKLGGSSAYKNGKVIKNNKTGGNIANVTSKASNTSTSTSTVTTTNGYDKDKPINGYFKIVYSTEQSWKAKTKNLYLTFTMTANSTSTLSGLTTVWVNNSTRKSSVNMKNWFADNEPNKSIYLHEISFQTPKIKATTNSSGSTTDQNWYTYDKSTHDNSSCKMDLYQIIFDDAQALNPTDLQSCGKTVISLMEEVVKSSDYRVKMTYGNHRCDDKINFSINNQTKPVFVATEGDNNNILEWSSINCTPVSDLRNKSICVFKESDNKYSYVDTADIESMLNYGEQTTLNTESDIKGSKEAYFIARNSEEYNPDLEYSYTIKVPYAPLIRVGDLVEVIANAKQLSDVKTVQSVKVTFNKSDMPHIQTEIGLDEVEPFLRIRKEQEKLRKNARSDKTWFGRTANPVFDEEVYIWDT